MITLKPIRGLLSQRFFIPRYQRGYRWGATQVRALLQDVMDFAEGKTPGDFYCLQPVVVIKSLSPEGAERWDVVDGQQRLTTVFLILQVLNARYPEDERYAIYSLDYESRTGSAELLQRIVDVTEAESQSNVDYHFMLEARTTIRTWLKDNQLLRNRFEDALLNKVQIIWYELPPGDDATAAFTRLNIGKIPLTDAELIRGLFLRSQNFPQHNASAEQLRLAQEWDTMEKQLQDNPFWFFLTGRSALPNRIELIFELVAKQMLPPGESLSSEHGCFIAFCDMLAQGNTMADLWNRAKACFMTLEEWYADQQLFHLIGFLIHDGDELLPLMELNQTSGKKHFREQLCRRILHRVFDLDCGPDLATALDEDLSDISYGSSRVARILLLFNIASIISNEKSIVRFRFDYFKKQRWDIEHIHAIASETPSSIADRVLWLQTVSDHFGSVGEAIALRERIEQMLQAKSYTNGGAFEMLYREVFECFQEQTTKTRENHEERNPHGLGNLALLDTHTNRSYKNAPFQVKRRLLLQRDQEGTFVPLCTRNAFLKAYSPAASHSLFWGINEQQDYVKAISASLLKFFTI
jgi:Protein of unknown function DUF262/Protein of unknown function (DUF1524)